VNSNASRWLADEPTGNLDPHTADEVHELFHLLNRELKVTLVIATHNERLMREMGRSLILRDGRLHEEPRTAV
jgi:ABC-type lipoprotein export system ATPase subunit